MRTRQRCIWCLLLVMLGHVIAAGVLRAQADRSQVIADKVALLETRVAVLENNMGEILWLARALTVAVIGQLALMLSVDRRRRALDPEILEYLQNERKIVKP